MLPPPRILTSFLYTKFVLEKDVNSSLIKKDDAEKEGGEEEFENFDGTVTDNRLCTEKKSKKVVP